MSDSYEIVFENVKMPDSLAKRRRLLAAMASILSDKHPAKRDVNQQIALIDEIEVNQERLNLKFNMEAKP